MKKILTCVGTRPNFIKVMLLKELFEQHGYNYELLHTGQHFDENMSDVFFRQLGLEEPDHHLGISGGTNAEVVGRIIDKAAEVMHAIKPDLVIVPGDVNSTFACAFAAASLDIPVAHIESGLRSFDMTMPEEKNRILTDRLSSLLFITEPVGVKNLEAEGVEKRKMHVVGNTIIDALITMLPLVEKSTIRADLGLSADYILFTFHRPVNVDHTESLQKLVDIIRQLSETTTCVLPMHPRTKARLGSAKLLDGLMADNCKLIAPLGYIEFLALMKHAACLISDSGGIQVETSYLNVPLVTVRDTTESIITLERGTNQLSSLDVDQVQQLVEQSIERERTPRINSIAGLWDGHASERIVEEVNRFLS